MQWLEQIAQQYRDAMSHVFVLTGNIQDYVGLNIPLEHQLVRSFARRDSSDGTKGRLRLPVLYDMATGITFLSPEDERKFDRLADGIPTDSGPGGVEGPNSPAGGGPGGLAGFGQEMKRMQQDSPVGALQRLDRALHARVPVETPDEELADHRLCVVIRHGEYLFPNGELGSLSPADRMQINLAERWTQDQEIGEGYHLILILANAAHDLHPRLLSSTSCASVLDIPLPDTEGREAYARHLLGQEELQIETDMTAREIATRTSGLARRHVEDIAYRAHAGKRPLTPELIHDRKKDILRQEYGDVLQVEEPAHGYELVPGHELVKTYFRQHVIPGLTSGDRRTPSGILMVGPPGTGKTWFAQATAKEAGVQFLQLNLGSLLNMYVGNSEARLDKALRAIWHLGGICLIDELDQQLSSRSQGGDTGSSVDNRFLGRLLAFMAEPKLKGRVVFLAATNRPDLLDAALKRSGRFDRKVPFLPPNPTERAGVIAAQLRFQDIHVEAKLVTALEAVAVGEESEDPESAEGLTDLLDATEGWVHSDFQNLVGKAWELANGTGDVIVTGKELGEAAHLLIPSRVDEHMLAVSLAEVNDLSLLPEAYRPQVQDREALRASADPRLSGEPTRRSVRS